MDSELEELESLFSEHFGRTPSSSQASYVYEEVPDIDDELDNEYSESTVTQEVDARARLYTEIASSEDEEDEDTVAQGNDPFMETIRAFTSAGCGCHLNCASHLTIDEIYALVLNVREMEKSNKEMYTMACLTDTTDKEKTKRGKKRQRLSHEFCKKGKRVCKRTFMLLFDVGKHCLQNLMKHVSEHGVVPRSHKNTGRRTSKSLQFEDIRRVVQFVSNYADEFGMPQPAAPRGRDDTPPVYLTSDTIKADLHQKYRDSCTETDPPSRAVKYSTFNNIWRSCLPHIKIATPRDDVCATCETLRKQVHDSVTEEGKLDSSSKLREHVLIAQKERDVYNTCIKQAKESYAGDERYIHYTFDFSQNICLPHHSRQMGPVYFATLRKIQIFGFRVDGIPSQLNFLNDESETIGPDGTCTHGPNDVISMIHWAIETKQTSGETSCTVHADNCPGQNKNKYVMGYFTWRVMTGRHQEVKYLMQVPGHARCLVDSGFASLKKLYRRCDCDSMEQLVDIVNKSSNTNRAVSYPAWQWHDWKSFLEPVIRPIPAIRRYQCFRMTSANPGIVYVKTASDAEEKEVKILRAGVNFQRDVLPPVIPASGLSRQRQEYLYKKFRPFVRPAFQDTLCPSVQQ